MSESSEGIVLPSQESYGDLTILSYNSIFSKCYCSKKARLKVWRKQLRKIHLKSSKRTMIFMSSLLIKEKVIIVYYWERYASNYVIVFLTMFPSFAPLIDEYHSIYYKSNNNALMLLPPNMSSEQVMECRRALSKERSIKSECLRKLPA